MASQTVEVYSDEGRIDEIINSGCVIEDMDFADLGLERVEQRQGEARRSQRGEEPPPQSTCVTLGGTPQQMLLENRIQELADRVRHYTDVFF